MSKTFRVVTVYNHPPAQDYYCFNEFFESVRRQGIEALSLGGFLGLGTKPKILYNAIVDGTITEDIIIFSDCYDVVFARPIKDMINVFEMLPRVIIISTEKDCFPLDHKESFDLLPQIDVPYANKYVNSGFIMGYTEDIKKMLEAMDAANIPNDYHDDNGWHHFNDQTMFQEIFLKQPVRMLMDATSIFSQTMSGLTMEDFDLIHDKHTGVPLITNKHSGIAPFSIHHNGGSKTLSGTMQPFLKHLNLR